MSPRLFGVTYQFLSAGSVFTDGLRHAAQDLGIDYQDSSWDVPDLQRRIAAFAPSLILAVHGRKFARRFPNLKGFGATTAVWLLDESYECDETASWSHRFDHVFVNDPSTLHRHRNASYLPVCYDSHRHYPGDGIRPHALGFIGGGNPTRDRYLSALAREGLLSYVVGGTWHDPRVQALCRSRNISPDATADLYRQTRIVVNIFREVHHYNREKIPARSMNPRIYEAMACGSLVVSESRPEIEEVVPELPTFRSEAELIPLVDGLLNEPDRAEAIRAQCQARLAAHTYADRLHTVIDVALGQREAVA